MSRIFTGYQSRDPLALSFYCHPPSLEALLRAAAEALQGTYARPALSALLKNQNNEFGGDRSSLRSIENLARPDSVAVLTGQQVGLFTGPMLTIHKALTAIRLSEELCRRGYNAVPVFWMATDDHDLAEITRLAYPKPGDAVQVVDARLPLFGTAAMPPAPVGDIRLPEAIAGVARDYAASLAGFEWSDAVACQIKETCRPGTTFALSFARLMAQIFLGMGLILFDPRTSEAKRLAAPLIGRALRETGQLRALIADRGLSLRQSGFEAQVAVSARSTMVFLEEDGQRRLLLAGDGEFLLKETGRRFTADGLLGLVETAPERFSPNVLLRPLVQDHLFPTAAYVGGPAEISYFAQVEPLYRFFGRPMPVIWPRSSFTILGEEVCHILKDRGLDLEDCFQGERQLFRKILASQPAPFEAELARILDRLDVGFEEVKPALTAAERSLGAAAETARRKIHHRIASLLPKFISSEMRQNRDLKREVLHLMASCCPNGRMQERELGIHILMARFGPSLLDVLYGAINTGAFAHQIVCLLRPPRARV